MKNYQEFKKSFKLLFIGLLVYIFAFDLSSTENSYFSTRIIMQVVGIGMGVYSCLKLNSVSKLYNKAVYVGVALAILVIGQFITNKLFAASDVSIMVNSDALEYYIFQYQDYISVYVNTVLELAKGILIAFFIKFLVEGTEKYLDRYCNSILKEFQTKVKKIFIFGLIGGIGTGLSTLSSIPMMNTWNTEMAALQTAGADLTDETIMAEFALKIISSIAVYSVLEIAIIVVNVIFFIKVIKYAFFCNRLSQIMPYDSYADGNGVSNESIDVEAKEVKEENSYNKNDTDDWRNDFK